MTSAKTPRTSQAETLLSLATSSAPRLVQGALLTAYGPPTAREGRVSEGSFLIAYAPPEARDAWAAQASTLVARSAGDNNVTAEVSQAALLIAYTTGIPSSSSSNAWTFVLDGHRFYVLPLGPEGDWSYDMTTQEWCQLQTQGFPGLNFRHGVMWGLRIIGGDALYTYLYELDPTQPLDEQWREVQHMVTGGLATRSRASIGVANVTVTASVGLDSSTDQAISLAYSDDNGVTWSDEFEIPLTDMSNQTLLWPALGSFSAPGRVFRITDYSGPIRLDGADAVLTKGSGVDAGQDQDG